jgi:choice-of-anchor C domain-containing protein
MRIRTVLVVLSFLLLPVSRAYAGPFTNGSFESASVSPGVFTTLPSGSTAITGWEAITASVDYIGTLWQHAQGNRSVDLNGNQGIAGIRQTFDTEIGRTYIVDFALAGNPDGSPTTKSLNVFSGAFIQGYTFSTVGASRADMNWVYKSFTFKATSTSSVLTFQSTTPSVFYGPVIDDVTVRAPEPMTLALFGTGALGLAIRRRVRRS